MNAALSQALAQAMGDRTNAARSAIESLIGMRPLSDVPRTQAPRLRAPADATEQAARPLQSALAQHGSAGAALSAAERWIIGKESGGRTTAKNPKSTAFGIWQGLQSTRNAYGRKVGVNPNTTDYNEQLRMMRAYIADRYGTAENAQRFWQRNGWY